MAHYLAIVEDRLKKLNEWIVKQATWKENVKADALAGIAATLPIKEVVMLPVYLQVTTSITPEPVYSSNEVNPSWMRDIIKYLWTRDLPEDRKKAHKLCVQATHFTLISDQLYKRSFGGPYLKCLSEPEAN